MKFSLTITDMTEDDVYDVISSLQDPATECRVAALDELNEPAEKLKAVVDAQEAETTSSTEELDSEGLPWDKRINSSSKKKKKDGTWARRKNIEDDLYESVKMELRGQVKTQEAADLGASLTPPPPPAAPAVEAQTPPPPPAAPATGANIQAILLKFQDLIGRGLVHNNYMTELVTELNKDFGTSANVITDIIGSQAMMDAALQKLNEKG